MASNEPVNSGEKIDVAGTEGVVVRGVAIRGGTEYTVRVPDENSAATRPMKLPQGYNPVAAYGTAEQAEVHEENRKRDKEEREQLEQAMAEERKEITEKENELTEKLRSAHEGDKDFDPSVNSHVISTEANRQVEEKKAEQASTVDGAAKADENSREEKLRGVSATGTPRADEHGASLANQDDRAASAPGGLRSGKTADAKTAPEGKRSR